MRIDEFLTESKNHPIIVVDVQPAYATKNNIDICRKIINFVNNQTGKVLMFVNAESDGMTNDTIQDIKFWWEEELGCYDEEFKWSRFEIIDKGYGFLRNWMDFGVDDAVIIKCIRELLHQRKYDTRELFGGDDSVKYRERMQEFLVMISQMILCVCLGTSIWQN